MPRIPYYLVANLLLSMVSSMCVNFGTLKFLEGILSNWINNIFK
jgi:hypothetical protein